MADASKTNQLPAVEGVGESQPEVVLGTLVRLDESGAPYVDWPGNPSEQPLRALCAAGFTATDVGRTAALLFVSGDPGQPLIVGLVHEPIDAVLQATEAMGVSPADKLTGVESGDLTGPGEACVDGDRMVVAADKEIVLQCGKASITLTRSGKILLRGAYLLSRSSGVNRIKGGSVQIN